MQAAVRARSRTWTFIVSIPFSSLPRAKGMRFHDVAATSGLPKESAHLMPAEINGNGVPSRICLLRVMTTDGTGGDHALRIGPDQDDAFAAGALRLPQQQTLDRPFNGQPGAAFGNVFHRAFATTRAIAAAERSGATIELAPSAQAVPIARAAATGWSVGSLMHARATARAGRSALAEDSLTSGRPELRSDVPSWFDCCVPRRGDASVLRICFAFRKTGVWPCGGRTPFLGSIPVPRHTHRSAIPQSLPMSAAFKTEAGAERLKSYGQRENNEPSSVQRATD